jgi:chemotaxis signal transduction protein/HPt (histidine-containing phosphotransfer) domain-containing protein
MSEFDDIIPEYITESIDLLQTVEKGLLQLEQGQAEDEVIHAVFRAIHSIKGGAGFVGLAKIERLAHKMEDLLNLIRNHDLIPSPLVVDSLIRSLDVLNSLFERVDEHDAIDIESSLRSLVEALQNGAGASVQAAVQTVSGPSSGSGLPSFEISDYALTNKLHQGNLFHLRLDLARLESRGITPIQAIGEMVSMGEILDSMVNLPQAGDPATYEGGEVTFDVLYATVLEADLLATALHLDPSESRQLSQQDFSQAAAPKAAPAPAAPASPRPAPPAAPGRSGFERESPKAMNAQTATQPSAPPSPPPPEPAPATPEAAPKESSRAGEYLTFILGGESYGVDILSVQEIMGMPNLTRLPLSPSQMLGVMNLRGMVVPVVDLRRKLGLPEIGGSDTVVVVVHVSGKVMGVVVDGVRDVVQLGEAQIQEPPEFAGPVHREYLRGLCRHEEEMLILLELDRLLSPEIMGHAA